jgi:ubiquinone/menaquinone biosynthesis C-methylase UbiE
MKLLNKKSFTEHIQIRRQVLEVAKRKKKREEEPKNQITVLNPVRRLFEHPQRHVEPYVTNGQVAADLGCGSGYYTLALAEVVGPEGRVYVVDLNEEAIQELEMKAEKRGYHNIEAHASSASDLSFIKDGSIDFVLANGLLCSMPDHRQAAVTEIKRILKPAGQAYLSLGLPPPIGHVRRAEWKMILEGFRVERRGGFFQKWAVVSTKQI